METFWKVILAWVKKNGYSVMKWSSLPSMKPSLKRSGGAELSCSVLWMLTVSCIFSALCFHPLCPKQTNRPTTQLPTKPGAARGHPSDWSSWGIKRHRPRGGSPERRCSESAARAAWAVARPPPGSVLVSPTLLHLRPPEKHTLSVAVSSIFHSNKLFLWWIFFVLWFSKKYLAKS